LPDITKFMAMATLPGSDRAIKLQELTTLKSDIDKGLADVAAGRVKKFDANKIIARGRKLLASR
jgi:antitoxin ParD1/3/4